MTLDELQSTLAHNVKKLQPRLSHKDYVEVVTSTGTAMLEFDRAFSWRAWDLLCDLEMVESS
jgi:hypothetical protein